MQREIGKYGLLLFVSLVGIVLPGLVHYGYGYGSLGSVAMAICLSLPLVALALLVPSRVLRGVLLTLMMIVSLIETAHTIIYWGDLSSAGYIRSLFMTTSHEADGALSVVLRQHSGCIILMAIYYIALITIVGKVTYRVKISLAGFAISAVIGGVTLLIGVGIKGMKHIEHIVPANVYVQSWEAVHQALERNMALKDSSEFTYQAKRSSIPNEQEIYVLVIDESLRYDHLSLGGYERETTPHLETMGNVINMENYYAPAVFTMYAVPLLLTPSPPETFAKHYSQRGVHWAFKECGFATYWVTHQGQLVNDGVSGYIAKGVDSIISVENDAEIPLVIKELSTKNDKLFVVAHLWGSHQFYANTSEMTAIYHPDIAYAPRCIKGEDVFVNSYDNTILQTDSIMAVLTDVLKQRDVVAHWMFVSDHGEGPIREYGGAHGYTKPYESEYHVPLLLWYSNKYMECYPHKVSNARKNQHQPVSGGNVFWSLLDMADIEVNVKNQKQGISIYREEVFPSLRPVLLSDGRSVLLVQ